jgi:hypothetical protein
VERPPQLVLRGKDINPVDAVWKLELDRPVPVKGSGRAEAAAARALYRANDGANEWVIPSAEQPGVHEMINAPRVAVDGQPLGAAPLRVGIRPGYAVAFERVSIAPGGERLIRDTTLYTRLSYLTRQLDFILARPPERDGRLRP